MLFLWIDNLDKSEFLSEYLEMVPSDKSITIPPSDLGTSDKIEIVSFKISLLSSLSESLSLSGRLRSL